MRAPHPAVHLPRPRLRGLFHAAMIPVAAVAGLLLFARTDGSGRWAVGVFAITLVGLYTASSLYHLPAWTRRAREVWLRVDNSTILLFIAGSFTPIAVHSLDGAWRVWSLVVAWAIAVGGVGLLSLGIRIPRRVGTAAYIAIGWLAVVPMTRIAMALPLTQVGLLALGGLFYTVGAVVFARARPNPWPAWFGHHEIFHLCVIAASTCHYLVVWGSVS